MSVKNFHDTQRIKIAETSEVVAGGSIKTAHHLELEAIILWLYKQGAAGGSEKIRAILYSDLALTKPYATSEWSKLSDIPSLGTYWFGKLEFKFAREHLNKNLTYYLGVETTGYTRDGGSFYLGFVQDFGIQQVGVASALAFELYGYRWV